MNDWDRLASFIIAVAAAACLAIGVGLGALIVFLVHVL